VRFFYDCEFSRTAPDVELLSLGVIAEDGRELYAVSNEVDLDAAHPWVRRHVLPLLPPPSDAAWMSRTSMRDELLTFLRPEPVLWAWMGAYDHVALCQLWGSMTELPRQLPRMTLDVRQLWESLGEPALPTQPGGRHRAIDDARHVRTQWQSLAERAYALGLSI